jgi:hypothetical protein
MGQRATVGRSPPQARAGRAHRPYSPPSRIDTFSIVSRGGPVAHDVFVSYASVDKPIADAAVASLEAAGLRCWYAPRDVLPGADWAGSIIDAITSSRLAVLVFSDATNASEHIIREVRQAADAGVPIVPFRIAPVGPSRALQYYIGGTHWLDAITEPRETHFGRLVDTALRVSGETPQAPVGERSPEAQGAPPPGVHEPGGRGSRRSPVWPVATVALVLAGIALVVVLGGEDPGSAGVTTSPDVAGDLERSILVPDGGFQWIVHPETGHSYALTRSGLSWQTLEDESRARGAHLVWIDDEAEERWLFERFPSSEFWIGLTDEAVEGEWRWTSGEPASYLNWCPGEPTDVEGGAGPENAAFASPGWGCWFDEVTWTTEFFTGDGGSIPSYPGLIEIDAG